MAIALPRWRQTMYRRRPEKGAADVRGADDLLTPSNALFATMLATSRK
jgi:hypothetical protein